MIHCCDKCLKPILIYGRNIPCKHVFCLTCAQAAEKAACDRCGDKVVRVEQAGLGSIYMCAHGGTRYGNDGCRRTYLSQRDLQAHIQHRHAKASGTAATPAPAPPPQAAPVPVIGELSDKQGRIKRLEPKASCFSGLPSAAEIMDVTKAIARTKPNSSSVSSVNPSRSYESRSRGNNISVVSSGSSRSSNLITVPLEDSRGSGSGSSVMEGGGRSSDYVASYYGQPQQTSQQQTSGRSYVNFSQPPPMYYGASGQQPRTSSVPTSSARGYNSSQQNYNSSSYYRR